MIKTIAPILLTCLCLFQAQGQMADPEELPRHLEVRETPERLSRVLDSASNATFMPLHARFYPTDISSDEAYRQGADYFWNLEAENFGIKAYLQVQIHPGDTLYLHNAEGEVLEKLHRGNHFQKTWISQVFHEKILLRYRNHSGRTPDLHIEGYSLQLPETGRKSALGFGDSDFCEVNINCEEGTDYQDVKKSVVRINIKLNGFEGWCTGTLVNTTARHYKPYIITAEHCALSPSNQFVAASDLLRWEFFFNYSAIGCSNPASELQVPRNRLIGSQLLARSDDNGGDFGSDFLLLELTDSISFGHLPPPYFAGWNRANTPPLHGVTIHHPEGDIKKISTFNISANSSEFGTTTQDTHWEIEWTATPNGHGVTEPGSSGCPVFDQNGLFSGVLTGGLAYCSNPTAPDYFGKFSYSWNQNGPGPDFQLKPWLDPENLGVYTLSGAYMGDTNVPDIPEEDQITLLPNPVTEGVLRIGNLGADQQIDVQIYSINGKQVLEQQHITGLPPSLNQPELNVQDLSNGLYLVRVIKNGTSSVQKVIIKNQN